MRKYLSINFSPFLVFGAFEIIFESSAFAFRQKTRRNEVGSPAFVPASLSFRLFSTFFIRANSSFPDEKKPFYRPVSPYSFFPPFFRHAPSKRLPEEYVNSFDL